MIRYRAPEGLAPPDGLAGTRDREGVHELRVDDAVRALHELTGWAIEHGVDLAGLEVARPSLEDVYLSLTESSGSGGGAS